MILVPFIEKFAGKSFSPRASIGSRSLAHTVSTNNNHFDLCQRRFRSASPGGIQKQYRQGFSPVYVHHVSKIALEHLQVNRSDWVHSQGLDTRLHINPNGTFVLSFPAKKGYDTGRIWTSYDSSQKQHWLSVYRSNLAVRFLLKDHAQSMSRNIHDSSCAETQIIRAVDYLISAVTQTEAAAAAAAASSQRPPSSLSNVSIDVQALELLENPEPTETPARKAPVTSS